MPNRLAKTPEAKERQNKGLTQKKKNPANFSRPLALAEIHLAKIQKINKDKEAMERAIETLPPEFRQDLETGEPLKTWGAIIRNYIASWPI